MTRAFVALDLADASLDLVAGVAEALRSNAPPEARARWTPREQLHVTVKFLGNASEEVLGGVGDLVRALAARAVRGSRFARIAAFPSPARATVLVCALEDEGGALASLARRFEEGALALGAQAEGRPYRPHVTLARLRAPLRVGPWIERTPFDPETLSFAALTLHRSDLGPSGARYSPLARVPFA